MHFLVSRLFFFFFLFFSVLSSYIVFIHLTFYFVVGACTLSKYISNGIR